MEMLKKFYEEEDGMGTVEIVMIIAALMCIALMFKNTIVEFAKDIIGKVFSSDTAIEAPSGSSLYKTKKP